MVVFTVERRSLVVDNPSRMESMFVGIFSSRAKVIAHIREKGESWREHAGPMWFWVDREIVDTPREATPPDPAIFEVDERGKTGWAYDMNGNPTRHQPPRYEYVQAGVRLRKA